MVTPSGPDFDSFFRAEHVPLLRYCWGLTLDREHARDTAQEALARAWRDWERIGSTRPAAWVRTVALNLVRSDWRRSWPADASSRVEPPGLEDVPVDLDLVVALRALPERQREAIVLHHLGDLSVDDCAAAMGVAPTSVKAHLQRGRARLAELLAVEDCTEVSP